MEYTDGQMEVYTMDNGNKIRQMAMHTRGGQVATNTMDSTKIIISMKRESNKCKANYTVSNIKKASVSALVKYLVYDLLN